MVNRGPLWPLLGRVSNRIMDMRVSMKMFYNVVEDRIGPSRASGHDS